MYGYFGVPVSEEHTSDGFAESDYSTLESEAEREERESAQAMQEIDAAYLPYLKGI